MAVEDRDQAFEKALSKHLRGKSAESSEAIGACPDAEILASYHETTLGGEEAARAKQHILTCERCAAILEQLQATDEIALPVAATAAAPQRAADGRAVHVLKPRAGRVWRWVAPVGAIAAAVLVWVSVRENRSIYKPAANELKVAAPTPPVMESVPAAIAKAKPPGMAPLAAQVSPAPPRRDGVRARVSSPAEVKNALTYSGDTATFLPGDAPAAAPRPSGLARAHAESAPNVVSKAGPENERASPRQGAQAENAEITTDTVAAEQKRDLDSAASNALPAAPAPTNREQPALSGGNAGQATTSEAAADANSNTLAKKRAASNERVAVAQGQQMAGMSRLKESPEMVLATRSSSFIVTAPGGSGLWRLGAAGLIAHSADGGKTWKAQASGVDTDLMAGAAVSEQVCWVVGSGGTVLRTSDGGAHWEKVSAPTQEDLISVAAVDVRVATVRMMVGAYRTADGGASWRKVGRE